MSLQINADELQGKIYALDADHSIQKTVIAGKKVMYTPETHQLVFSDIKGRKEPMGEKIGMAVADLLINLFGKSGGSIPKGALLPAGMVLCAHAAQFSDKAGIGEVDDKALDEAISMMTVRIADKFDKSFRSKIGKEENAEAKGAAESPAEMGSQVQPATQQPAGLIGAQ